MHRDGGRCRICGATRWLNGHHVAWWTKGGRTDLDNLIVTCYRCHKLFHEGGWTIEGDVNGPLVLRRPDGRVLPTGPPPLRPRVRDALERAIGRPAAAAQCRGGNQRSGARAVVCAA
jgi:hypothetical protein